MQKTPSRRKAFSYIRFSTPEQQKGDSLNRQAAAARRYAVQHKLDLDEKLTFRDLGVSAHHGRNAEVGALGAFLDAVKAGVVPTGSFLLVESLDRISRQIVRRAVRTLESLVDAGITVVDLSDSGRAYNTETLDGDPFAFVMMALRFIRAHEESATKGMRVAAAYSKKRELAAAGTPLDAPFTRRLPGWIRWDDTTRGYVIDEPRARVVREMFKKADAGWGSYRIAGDLVARKVQPWGDGLYWHRSYVRRILANPAVLGTFTPHKIAKGANGRRQRVPQQPIPDFWPAIVEKELFARVTAQMEAPAAKGRNAGKPVNSIFAGMLHCSRCGGLVPRVSKGEHVYLVCSRAHAHAGCKYQAVRYADVESALITNAKAVVADAPRGEATAALELEISNLDSAIFEMTQDARALVDELASNRSETVRMRLRELEIEIEKGRQELITLSSQVYALSGPYVSKRLANLQGLLTAAPLNLGAVNKALKEAMEKVVIDPEAGRLAIYWRNAPAAPRLLGFYSRHHKEFASEAAAAVLLQ